MFPQVTWVPVFLFLVATFVTQSVFANYQTRHPQHDGSSKSDYRALSPYLAGGYGVGGDAVARFADSAGEVEKVRSGGGLLVEAGLLMPVDPWSNLRLTVGYQANNVSRLNGDSSFERVRFDFTLLRGTGLHEFGVGLTAHTSVRYSCNIRSVCAGDVDFDPVIGFTLEYAMRFGVSAYDTFVNRRSYRAPGLRLGVRYTGIEYTPKLRDAGDEDVRNGNSFMGFLGVSF